jgi:hypothetical protein
MCYGYTKRTEKRDDYKYWYLEKNSGKYYEGLRYLNLDKNKLTAERTAQKYGDDFGLFKTKRDQP